MKEPYSPLNKIWAPWRLQYVQNIPAKGCVFCKMRKENNDKNNYIFARSGHCFAVLNIFPYNNGHSLIVTNRHVDSLQRLNSEEILDLNKLLNIVTAVLEKILRPSGLNVGFNIGNASGAGIKKHLHMHIVPRWQGDVNFMTTISDTKVISQSLSALHKEMRKELTCSKYAKEYLTYRNKKRK